jgi:hypothetical protein
LLPILPIRRNVTILQGDFLSLSVQEQLAKAISMPPTKITRVNPPILLADNPPQQEEKTDGSTPRVDTVLSDMMANMSGIRARDIEASLELCEMALHFSRGRLKSGLTKAPEEDAEGKKMLTLKDYRGNMLCVSLLPSTHDHCIDCLDCSISQAQVLPASVTGRLQEDTAGPSVRKSCGRKTQGVSQR